MTDELSGTPRVPLKELEELIEEWRDSRESFVEHEQYAIAAYIKKCADELETLLEEYQYE